MSVCSPHHFPIQDYDLDATLGCGQAFRWQRRGGGWIGVVGEHPVRLQTDGARLVAESAVPVSDWAWLADYLQLGQDLQAVLESFPDDEPMRASVTACRGLRLLRQAPWECLASFILSSNKQIVQIQQIIETLCQRYGEPLPVCVGFQSVPRAFPSAERLASATEAELRGCKMGFRAPYLLAAARAVADGRLDLNRLAQQPLESARARLMELPGVGRKIADCTLLFGCGFNAAFPVDVWVMRALRQLYFPRRRVSLQRLHRFAATHFGPYGGYAQQYLFHYVRTRDREVPGADLLAAGVIRCG
jgi:N-glycosylase/DNA lyase